MKRNDDFEARRKHLAALSDEALKERFWQLTREMVSPMLQMGREYTTPSIESSVLLRMGFSSVEAKQIVAGCLERSLLGHGAGNVVYRLAKKGNEDYREAGRALAQGKRWDEAEALFEGVRA